MSTKKNSPNKLQQKSTHQHVSSISGNQYQQHAGSSNVETISHSTDSQYHQHQQVTASHPSQKELELSQKIAELQAKVSIIEKEKEDWKQKAYRFSADMQNLSKQNDLDKQHIKKITKKSVVSYIAPFINTLFLSFQFTPQTEDKNILSFVQALRSSYEQLMKDLENLQVELIIPRIGDSVDPEYMTVLNADQIIEHLDKVVVQQVVSIGIRIDSQLVQEASVMVAIPHSNE